MEKRVKNFLFFIALFILYAVYSSIIIYILSKIGININNYNTHTKNLYLILIDVSLMFIIYLTYRKDTNRELFKYGRHFGKYFVLGLKMWLLGIVLMITSNLIINALYPATTAVNENAVQAALKEAPIYMAFSACIFAPFMEEMIFRKSLQKAFKNDTLFIIISGLLFGLAHNINAIGTPNMIYIIPYGLFGCVFAYTYVKTNDIFVPITFHMIHNIVLIITSLLSIGVI
jgi:membrane protease YdiL (CAAX protease family)